MNEHGIPFLKQKNVGRANRRSYAAMTRRFSVIFALVCFLMGKPALSALANEKEVAPVKRVLVLNSYHPNYEWGRSVMGGIESVFDNTDIDVLCSYEYMDTKHHRPHIIFELLKELYSKKYAGFKFDVIIAADNNALDFLLAYRDTLFPGSPVVFCGITGFSESMIMGHWGFTGILENYDIKGTIEMALAIHPETRNIAVISGVSTSSRIHQYRFMQVMPAFKERVNFTDLTRLDVPQLTNRLAKLPAHTIILYLADYKTPSGTFLAVSESTSLVLKHSGRPAYSMWEHTLGNGIVGGMMLSGDVQGHKAAEYALKILKGTAIETLPVIPASDVSPVFDHRMLKHFNSPQSKLPKNAVIRNEPQTLYYRYKYLIWAFVALAFYQSFTILTLRRDLGKRKQTEVDLAESRAQLQSILTSIKDCIKIEVKTLSDTSIVLADPNKLLQVIMNLCTNAEQAMRGQNGILTITLDRVMISEDAPLSVLELKPGSYVRLSVADTGCGMDPSILNRIFEPFYTTRKPSEGTGLGLSVAHGIIKGYGGVITVESAPAKGSTFKAYLSTVDEETLTTSLPAAASLQTGNERILLVDDDTDMLYSIKKLLERLGYAVVSCLESSQALETFRQDPNEYSLIIADQIMPSMTGLQLSKEISNCRPDIPIILCSGVLDEHSVEVSTELLQNNGIAAFINKPFRMLEISQVIRRVRPIGSRQEVASDFRLVAATHRNLEQMVARGAFRSDLFFRIQSVGIALPALRERAADIRAIATHHLQELCRRLQLEQKGVSEAFFEVLEAFGWPGNVRELVSALEQAVVMAHHDPTLYPVHLPGKIRVEVAQAALSTPCARPEETGAYFSRTHLEGTRCRNSGKWPARMPKSSI